MKLESFKVYSFSRLKLPDVMHKPTKIEKQNKHIEKEKTKDERTP